MIDRDLQHDLHHDPILIVRDLPYCIFRDLHHDPVLIDPFLHSLVYMWTGATLCVGLISGGRGGGGRKHTIPTGRPLSQPDAPPPNRLLLIPTTSRLGPLSQPSSVVVGIKTCISTCALSQPKKWDIFLVGIGAGAINGQGRGNIDQDSGIFGPGGPNPDLYFRPHILRFIAAKCIYTRISNLGIPAATYLD